MSLHYTVTRSACSHRPAISYLFQAHPTAAVDRGRVIAAAVEDCIDATGEHPDQVDFGMAPNFAVPPAMRTVLSRPIAPPRATGTWSVATREDRGHLIRVVEVDGDSATVELNPASGDPAAELASRSDIDRTDATTIDASLAKLANAEAEANAAADLDARWAALRSTSGELLGLLTDYARGSVDGGDAYEVQDSLHALTGIVLQLGRAVPNARPTAQLALSALSELLLGYGLKFENDPRMGDQA